MNVHKNARSCPSSRELLCKRVCEQGWSVHEASEVAGISDRRGREWLRRWLANEPMTDRSSRPHAIESTEEPTRERILTLRREWRTVRQIALEVGVGASTVARICRAAGLSRLRQLEAPAVPIRYEPCSLASDPLGGGDYADTDYGSGIDSSRQILRAS
jgi:transposase